MNNIQKKIISYFLSTILLFTLTLPVSAQGAEEIKWEDKITATLTEKLEESNDEDILSVAVWTKDIDQEYVEKKVEEETGYNRVNVIQKYEVLSDDINKLAPGSYDYDKMYKDHNINTAQAREKERVAVDIFNETNRRIAKNEFNIKNSEDIEVLGIEEKEIKYISKYAPMLLLNLSAAKIRKIAQNNSVVSIDYLEELKIEKESLDSAIRNIDGQIVRDSFGFDGTGINIGQYEEYLPEYYSYIENVRYDLGGSIEPSSNNQHALNVACIMHTIAPAAELYCMGMSNSYGGGGVDIEFYDKIDELIKAGANLINMSAGFIPLIRISWYTNEEKYIDYIEGPYGISFVKSAGDRGNFDGAITSPGLAYNAITVGAILDNDTYLVDSDDTYDADSSSANSGNVGCAKPDVLAPGNIYGEHGTSFAAAVVSGTIAQLMEYKPALKTNSRLVKAVLTASCDRKINESVYDGLTAYEGAGVINAWLAYMILANGHYASGSFSTLEKTFSVTSTGTICRIALTWARLSISHYTAGTYVNLDLYVYNTNGSYLTGSGLTTSSAEMACFNNSLGTYTVKIRKADTAQASNTVWYAFAWR